MSRNRLLSTIAALALALAIAAPAGADPAPTTVDEVSASVSGSTISVTGAATFGGQDPVEVGFDGTGDSLVPQGVGLDIDRLYIQRSDGSSNDLIFTLKLDGLTGGGIPEAFQYNWDISVDGGAAAGGSEWSLKTMRSGQGGQAGTAPWASIYSCTPSDTGFDCSPLASIAVVYDADAGEIRMTVPLFRINATASSTIEAWARNGQPVWVRTSAAGVLTGGVTADDAFHDTYAVPGNTVKLGVAPAGTPESLVSFTTDAAVSGGAFTGSLSVSEPGAYDVYAKACFGANCAVGKTPVTIG